MATPVTNFGKVTVSTGYNAADTSIVLTTGHGSRLPSTFPYPLSWWDATTYSDPADDPSREIITVTNRSGDTLTITRASEGTSASTKNTSAKTYKMVLGLTKAMYDALFTLSLSQSFRGLTMQTHPDSDKAAAQVRFSADAIVMDDGQEVRTWTNLDVSLAASGLNGLDTGAEAASVWYEVWAIYNGTTKAGVLHRAKDYFFDQDITAGEDGAVALRDATARTKIAQGFKLTNAGLVEFVDVKILKTAAPTGNFWLTIEATSGGVPSGTPLATSDKYDVSRLTTTATLVRMPFRVPASLSAATQYHLVLQGDFTVSVTNFMSWRADTTAAAYANGSKATFDGTTWTNDATADFTAKIYVTRNDVNVTMPAGYTQKALIGYAYNNASSNLKHFWAKDRTVFGGHDHDWQVGALAATTPAILTDLFAFLPPTTTIVGFEAYNATASNARFANISGPDALVTGAVERIGSVEVVVNALYTQRVSDLVFDPYQGFMYANSAGTLNLYVDIFTW